MAPRTSIARGARLAGPSAGGWPSKESIGGQVIIGLWMEIKMDDRRTGADLDEKLRLAGIMQGIKKRVIDGTASSSHAKEMSERVHPLVDRAMEFAVKAGI